VILIRQISRIIWTLTRLTQSHNTLVLPRRHCLEKPCSISTGDLCTFSGAVDK